METVIVERVFPEPIDLETYHRARAENGWCLEQYGITYIRTLLSRDRKRAICMYLSPDAESVRRACAQMTVPFEHVWTATVLEHSGEARADDAAAAANT